MEDLFENIKTLPKEIKDLIEEYSEKANTGGGVDYKDTKELQRKFEELGYTFEYGLDNEPHNLRKLDKLDELMGRNK